IRELVSVISGPVCQGNLVWWEVGRNGNSGWAAEINGYNNRNLLLNGAPLPGGGSSGGGSSNPQPQATTPLVVVQPTSESGLPPEIEQFPVRNIQYFPVVLVDGSVFTFQVDWDRA